MLRDGNADLRQYPIHGRLLASAPGLTVEAIDSLLRDAWVAGFEAGVADVSPHIEEADNRTRAARTAVGEVINRRLIHVSGHLRRDRSKTNIAAEREWMERQAAELDRAINELREI